MPRIGPVILAVLGAAFLVHSSPAGAAIKSYAIVQDDGSLKVRGRTIRLHGIWIPGTERSCRTAFRPVLCADRAVLALRTKIEGFVHCEPVGENDDGSLSAICTVEGDGSVLDPREDLAAWMLVRGWAVARPEAPFEYHVLERIARAQGAGIWGFSADVIQRRRR